MHQNDFKLLQTNFILHQSNFELDRNDFILYQSNFVLYQSRFILLQSNFELDRNDFILGQSNFILLQTKVFADAALLHRHIYNRDRRAAPLFAECHQCPRFPVSGGRVFKDSAGLKSGKRQREHRSAMVPAYTTIGKSLFR